MSPMAVPNDSASRGRATAPVDEAHRLWDAAQSMEAQRPRTSYVEALKVDPRGTLRRTDGPSSWKDGKSRNVSMRPRCRSTECPKPT